MENESTIHAIPIPEGFALVAQYTTFKHANEHALVILSMRIPYWMYEHAGSYYLCVEEKELEHVSTQIAKYDQESLFWPPKPPAPAKYQDSAPFTLLSYALLLIGVFYFQQQLQIDITALGCMDTQALFNSGEIWRPITALTLHGDIGHLFSNIISGICFALVINQTFGAGLGWLLILLSGIFGNIVNGYTYYPNPHLSIGASTAIFGALGILVGHAVEARFSPNSLQSFKHRLAPLFAGIVLLGTMGAGGENTDVLAHVFGFVCGLFFGFIGNKLKPMFQKQQQQICLITTPVLLLLAWLFAFL